MKKQTILVTGGAGFVGSVCVELLVAQGYQVIVLDNLQTGNRRAVHPKARMLRGSIGNARLLQRVLLAMLVHANTGHPGARELVTAFWSDRAEWGLPFSIAATAGVLLAAAQLLFARLDTAVPTARQRILLFAAFIIPYQLLWWQGFSYQTRYLLASAPMFAALGGYSIDWLLQRMPVLARMPQPAVLGLAAGLLALGAYGRLGAVYHLALHPLQSDSDKLARLSPGLWPLAQRMRATLPAGSRLYTMEGALAYWLPEYPYQYGFPVALADLRGFDYLVVTPIGKSVYAFGGTLDNEVLRALGDPALLPLQFEQVDGAAVYAVGAGLR